MILLDTSFVVAFYNERDAHHAAASTAFGQIIGGDWPDPPARVCLPGDHDRPCSRYFLEAYQVFREQRVTHLSFADAAIVAVARDRSAKAIASFDRDFYSMPEMDIELVPAP